jgi:hypothetical protein
MTLPLPQTFPEGTRIKDGDRLGTVAEWQGSRIMRVTWDDGCSSIGAAYPYERVEPLTEEEKQLDRCRGCGSVGAGYTVAEEGHEWVMDEDDLGYSYCPPCVIECHEDLGLTPPARHLTVVQ